MPETSINKQILLVGNPNVGKSTVFNLLCNKKQKTGNYAGVTVASYSGTYDYKGESIEVVDLPGSYSVYPTSEDEAIFSKFLIDEQQNYSGVVYILEALSIKRGLLLFQQIQDLGIPILLVVNQIDQAERRGININLDELSKELKVTVLKSNAKQNQGIEELREEIFKNKFTKSETVSFEIPLEQKGLVFKILSETKEENQYKIWPLLSSETYIGKLETVKEQMNDDQVKCLVPKRLQTQETIRRYQNIDKIISKVLSKKIQFKELLTEKLDKVLVHQFWGYIIFGAILLFIFPKCILFGRISDELDFRFFPFVINHSKHLSSRRTHQFFSCQWNYSRLRWNYGFCAPNRNIALLSLFAGRFRIHVESNFFNGPFFKTFWPQWKKHRPFSFWNSLCDSGNYVHQKYRKRQRKIDYNSRNTFYDVFCATSRLQHYYWSGYSQ